MSSRLLLLNVNTNDAVTSRLATQARRAAKDDTTIEVLQPAWGVSSVESAYDAYISVTAGLDRIHDELGPGPVPTEVPWDAMIWGGFGDPGSQAFEDLLGIPVFDLATSAARTAFSEFGRYAVLSTVARMTPLIWDLLKRDEAGSACTGIHTIDLSVERTAATSAESMIELLSPLVRRAIEDGANGVCLGSGALVGLAETLTAETGHPVIDGVTAAVRLAESTSLPDQPDRTRHQPLPVKKRPGWPVGSIERREPPCEAKRPLRARQR